MPHGVMIDSLNTRKRVHLPPQPQAPGRTPRRFHAARPRQLHLAPVGRRHKLYSAMRDVYRGWFARRANARELFSIEFVLTYMGVLDQISQQELGGSLWAAGDGRL